MSDEVIQYRKEYVIECDYAGNRTTHRFDDIVEADRSLIGHVATLSDAGYMGRLNEDGEFGGRLTWYVDEVVPLTYFDELVSEYSALHGGQSLDEQEISRGDRYLLVEENTRGGYWLTTGDDANALLADHVNQEYADDWELVGVFDLAAKRELNVTLSATIEE